MKRGWDRTLHIDEGLDVKLSELMLTENFKLFMNATSSCKAERRRADMVAEKVRCQIEHHRWFKLTGGK